MLSNYPVVEPQSTERQRAYSIDEYMSLKLELERSQRKIEQLESSRRIDFDDLIKKETAFRMAGGDNIKQDTVFNDAIIGQLKMRNMELESDLREKNMVLNETKMKLGELISQEAENRSKQNILSLDKKTLELQLRQLKNVNEGLKIELENLKLILADKGKESGAPEQIVNEKLFPTIF